MEHVTLKQLAKESGRSVVTLKRYALRGELPMRDPECLGPTKTDWTEYELLEATIYEREPALEFIAKIRRNVRRQKAEPEALSEIERKVEGIKTAALLAAQGSAISFMRTEIQSAHTGKEWAYEAKLHREMADMLDALQESIEVIPVSIRVSHYGQLAQTAPEVQ